MTDSRAGILALWIGAAVGFIAYGYLKTIEFRILFRRAWERIPESHRIAVRNSLLSEEGIGQP